MTVRLSFRGEFVRPGEAEFLRVKPGRAVTGGVQRHGTELVQSTASVCPGKLVLARPDQSKQRAVQ